MNNKLVIGLIGEKGAGKETLCTLFKELGPDKSIVKISSSTLLAKSLDMWDLPKTRNNLQQLAILLEESFGKGVVANAGKKLIEQSREDIILFDSVRWQSQFDMIRSFPNSLIIYITASPEVRFERTKLRQEKVGENEITLEKFIEEEQIDTETMIPSLGQKADIKIENNGSIQDLKMTLSKLIDQL